MGKAGGFLEFERKDPAYRPVQERITDYKPVELSLSQQEIIRQAARCMDCGTPFCHAYGCPLFNIIPEFNDYVYRGKWQSALDLLLSTNNFPEFTARVCPALCEAACVAGINGDPVTIRQIELSIIEKGFESGYIRPGQPIARLDKSVAIVGAGPSGMTVANELNRAGYRVTVFDSAGYAGGILRYGIPDFKLEKWVVQRRVSLMEEEGVAFETGVEVGRDISFHYLKNRFDAICLAGGAREPRDLNIKGRDLKGIHFALDYLIQQNMRMANEPLASSEDITANEKVVVVIGGGDSGSDCLGTAIRQGAKKVYQLEILPEPPAERSPSAPWPMWPIILRKTHVHEEGVKPRFSMITKEFLGKEGKLTGLRCAEVEWEKDKQGRSTVPVEKPGTEFMVEAEMAILAMGYLGPGNKELVSSLGLGLDERGNIKADAQYMTNVPGLFVTGDMSQGQSLVVRAIAHGRKTAGGIIAYLGK
ncbi:MAG: glutamate synthase subunit beta [Deltaproteobacteria bacterium]|nr:glutamate synthase subunit beta [Deltaproteobacteria bacterium]